MSDTAKPLNALLSASMDCLLILVVSARPVPEVVAGAAALRCAVEQLPAGAQRVCAAVVRGIRVVDASIRPRECAQTVQLHVVQVDVGGARRAEVEAAARTPVLLGEERKVPIEVTRRGHPGEAPAHALSVGEQPLERRARYGHEAHVAVLQVDHRAGQAIRGERAPRAGRLVVRPEHQVVDEQLRASGEELAEAAGALGPLEDVLLLDRHPRQLLALARELVAAPSQLLLLIQQLPPGREPFVACSDHHDSSSRAGRPKRSKLANSRFGSIGSSTQRPYDWVAGMSVARTTNATTSLIFSPRNVRTFRANGR